MGFINADSAVSRLHRWLINAAKQGKQPWARRDPVSIGTIARYEIDFAAVIAALQTSSEPRQPAAIST